MELKQDQEEEELFDIKKIDIHPETSLISEEVHLHVTF